MRRECREHFPRHRLRRKPLISDHGMHHGTCVTHVPWCMPGSLNRGVGENVPGVPGAYATRKFTYLLICPWQSKWTALMDKACISGTVCDVHFNLFGNMHTRKQNDFGFGLNLNSRTAQNRRVYTYRWWWGTSCTVLMPHMILSNLR